MLKMKAILPIFCLLGILFIPISCTYLQPNKEEVLSLESDFKKVRIDGKYQLSIPNYMRKTDQLNDEASLQYNNPFKETYTIVIDENKEQFLSAIKESQWADSLGTTIEIYRKLQMSLLGQGIAMTSVENLEVEKIGRLNAKRTQFEGKIEGVDEKIKYLITFVEGRNDLYMIMSWTLNDFSKKYLRTYHQIADSFQEI